MKHLIYTVCMATLIVGCGGGKADAQAASEAPAAAGAAPSPAPAASSPAPVALVDVLDRSSTIAGPDANSDGVRDDINKWLDAQPLAEPQKRAAMQLARTFQRALLVNATDRDAAAAIADTNYAAMRCLSAAYEPNAPEPRKVGFALEAMTANTKERAMQYIKYNAALGGMAFQRPTNPKCD